MSDDETPEPAGVESPLSMRQLFDAITPPGTDGAGLLDALKGARRPVIPLSQRSLPPGGPDYFHGPGHSREPRAVAAGPADPFSRGAEASAALAEMYDDFVAARIPVASVEAILGHMLASHARNEKAGDPPGAMP